MTIVFVDIINRHAAVKHNAQQQPTRQRTAKS